MNVQIVLDVATDEALWEEEQSHKVTNDEFSSMVKLKKKKSWKLKEKKAKEDII